MGKIKSIIIFLILSFFVGISISFAGIKMSGSDSSIGDINKITDVSNGDLSGGTAIDKIDSGTKNILQTIKIIFSGIILAYLVYIGFQMVMAMGADDKLATAKRQIYYTLLAFLFINIPGSLYDVFSGKVANDVTSKTTSYSSVSSQGNSNMFINFDNWHTTIEDGVINFIKAIVVGIVIMLFMMAGISLISSAGNDEKRKKARTRFMNGIYGLVFLGIIQIWVQVVYSGNIPRGQGIFAQITNLGLFFAGPVAVFFLILGGFYYITSVGDEARAKKGMMIIKNTVIAVIILLACYAFLKDLSDFKL